MAIVDTYKWGSLYVDADGTIEYLRDGGVLTGDREEVLAELQDFPHDLHFDEDWPHGAFYDEGQDTPLVQLGWFGGYPGEALHDANAQAALEWAEGRYYIVAYSSWFGGCQSVQLMLNWDNVTLEELEEVLEMIDGFREYPVLDEDLYSQIESERWVEMIDDMVVSEENEREIVFTEDQKQEIIELTGEYYGYWEEGYFPADEWDRIIEEILAEEPGTVKQLHQKETLF